MEWLKNSILTMDNKHVPSDQAEIKKSLHDIKKFRLEEYAAHLKEKKTLIQLSDELTVSYYIAVTKIIQLGCFFKKKVFTRIFWIPIQRI